VRQVWVDVTGCGAIHSALGSALKQIWEVKTALRATCDAAVRRSFGFSLMRSQQISLYSLRAPNSGPV